MNLHCWWFGCERRPDDWSPPDASSCFRCGGYVEYSDMVGDTRHYRLMERLHCLWRFFYRPKCPECGHRFKCDESVDHIPF